jgi:hypothetical protein
MFGENSTNNMAIVVTSAAERRRRGINETVVLVGALLVVCRLEIACCSAPKAGSRQPLASGARSGESTSGSWDVQCDRSSDKPAVAPATADDPKLLQLVIAAAEPWPATQGAIKVTIRNVSDDWLWVTYGFGVGPKERGSKFWLEVYDAKTGQSHDGWFCFSGRTASGPPLYMDLSPRGEFSLTRRLDCLGLPHRGPWRIIAHFRDNNRAPPPPPEMSSWFVGELVSNVLEMEVKDPPRPKNAPANGQPRTPETPSRRNPEETK